MTLKLCDGNIAGKFHHRENPRHEDFTLDRIHRSNKIASANTILFILQILSKLFKLKPRERLLRRELFI